MGVPFPGDTYAEPGQPNWVGYMARDFKPKNAAGEEQPLLVFDYAIGGQTVDGVKVQAERYFLPTAGRRPDWAPWTSADTLFSAHVFATIIGMY